MTSGEKAEPERSAISSTEMFFKWCERCGHHKDDHGTPDRHCVWMLCACQRLSGGPFGFEVKEKPEPEEPPLTPEEEEEASEDACTCSARTENEDGFVVHDEDCDAREEPHPFRAYCRVCDDVHEPHKDCPSPPQPDRRPPYLLAYSVQGHLYEVALPGDATVAALDGRLVITHRLGRVAGICQIAPITSEESA
jgi:hypothetical protein